MSIRERFTEAIDFFCKLYDLRYFWMHLVKIDLKNKFRRSKLGILWTFISPLCLTAIMATVFSVAFHYDILDYTPYVLSGILFWDIVTSSFSAGGFSVIGNDCFIRQCNHPITMYTLKSSLVYIITFLIAMISLMIWVVIRSPLNVVIGILTLPITVVIYFAFSWGATTIAGFTCAQYRDYPMMVPLILQVFWYLSPVFFQESLFASNELLYLWFRVNPITHMLYLIRKPFLNGILPSWKDYFICLLFVIIIDLWAVYIVKRKGRSIIFYL